MRYGITVKLFVVKSSLDDQLLILVLRKVPSCRDGDYEHNFLVCHYELF